MIFFSFSSFGIFSTTMGQKKTGKDEEETSTSVKEKNVEDHAASLRERVAKFRFEEFRPTVEDFRYYLQRFEISISVNGLDGEESLAQTAKRNLILKCVGAENYRTIVDHFDPKSILEVKYDVIVEFLKTYFAPTMSYLSERVKFQKLYQKGDQSVAQFINELRAAAVGCKFKSTLGERLRDQLLAGLRDPSIQEELFMRHPEEEAALTDIEKTALIIKSAKLQRKQFEHVTDRSSE